MYILSQGPKMEAYPTALKLVAGGDLEITWSDQRRRQYTVGELRDHCPCATCRDKRRAAAESPPNLFPILTPGEARPLAIEGMKPVGSYAYSIAFSDGHNTGIFTFELLQALGRDVS